MKYLIRLYPRAWRARYGEEFAALVEAQPVRPGLVLDILAGAIDAHLAPQLRRGLDEAVASTPGGTIMKRLALRCAGTAHLSLGEQLRFALLVLASSLATTLAYIWIKRVIGGNLFVEALGIALFPMVMVVGTMPMYLRNHSIAARIVLCGILLIVVYLASVRAAWT